MSKTRSLSAAAFCAALLLSTGLNRCRGAETPTAEQKIEQELEKPTQLQFIETPLQDVIDYLKKRHGIEIQVDRKALGDVGLDPSTLPMTKKLKGVSLRSALELTLHDLDLTYLVQDEVLLITTPEEEMNERLTTRLYPVGDLIASHDKHAEKGQREELIHAIITTVAPWSWESVGGQGSIAATSFQAVPTLAVWHRYHVQSEIAAFLEEQRKLVQAEREAAVPRCPMVDIEMTPAAEKIEKTLKQPTEFSFVETALQDVVDHLKKKHDIEIQIDRKALSDVGLDASTLPITKNCKGISLRSALRLLLRELDLTYVIQDEVLLITTLEEAESRLTTRIYAVGDLSGLFRLPLGSPSSAVHPMPGTLADMICEIVEPTSWDAVGGPGSIASGAVGGLEVLIVSQTQEVHEKILQLIEHLREFLRCNRANAVAAGKPTADKPATDDGPKAPPAPPRPAKTAPGDGD